MQPKILKTWEEMRNELSIAKNGHTFCVEIYHNAFLLKQAVMRSGLKNITILVVRG